MKTTTNVINDLLAALKDMRERETQRRELAGMGEHELKDIGLTRADALVELAKPFWR